MVWRPVESAYSLLASSHSISFVFSEYAVFMVRKGRCLSLVKTIPGCGQGGLRSSKFDSYSVLSLGIGLGEGSQKCKGFVNGFWQTVVF